MGVPWGAMGGQRGFPWGVQGDPLGLQWGIPRGCHRGSFGGAGRSYEGVKWGFPWGVWGSHKGTMGVPRGCNGAYLGVATGGPPGAASPRSSQMPHPRSSPALGCRGSPLTMAAPRGPAGAAPAEPRPVPSAPVPPRPAEGAERGRTWPGRPMGPRGAGLARPPPLTLSGGGQTRLGGSQCVPPTSNGSPA